MLVDLSVGRWVRQFFVALQEQLENLSGGGEAPVSRQEHVDVGGFEFSVVGGEGLDQFLQRARLDEPDTDRLPFQVGDLVIWIL